MDTVTLGDKLQVNFDEVEEYLLCSGNVYISVNKQALNYPSLKARSKVVDKACKIHLDTSIETLVTIGNIINNRSTLQSIIDNTMFINSLGDEKLEKDYTNLYRSFKYIPYNNFCSNPEPESNLPPNINLEQVPINMLLCNLHTIKHALSCPHIYLADKYILSLALEQLCDQKPTVWLTHEFDNLPRFASELDKINSYKLFLTTDDHLISYNPRPTYMIPKYKWVIEKLRRYIREYPPLEHILREGYAVLGGRSISLSLFSGLLDNIHLYLTSTSHLDTLLSYFTDIEHKENKILARTHNQTFIIHTGEDFKLSIESSPYSIYRCYFDGQDLYMTTQCMLSILNDRIVYVNSEEVKERHMRQLLGLGFVFIDRDIPTEVSDNYYSQNMKKEEDNYDDELGLYITTLLHK